MAQNEAVVCPVGGGGRGACGSKLKRVFVVGEHLQRDAR